MDKIFKIAISGHRDLKLNKIDKYQKEIEQFLKEEKNSNKNIRIISPLADGADRLIVKAAQNLGLEYEVYLPMPIELYLKDFSPNSKKEFEEFLEKAVAIEVAPFCKGCNAQNIADYGKWRNLQYQYMGFTLVDKADKVLFLFDGNINQPKTGGTADILLYAKKHNKPYKIIKVEREGK